MNDEHYELSLIVRGVVTALGSDDAEGGCYVRLRVTEADASKLARCGAFGRILQLRLPAGEGENP